MRKTQYGMLVSLTAAGLLLAGCEQQSQQPEPPAGQQTPMPFPNMPQPPAQPQQGTGQQPVNQPTRVIRELLTCWKGYQQFRNIMRMLAENEGGQTGQDFLRDAEDYDRRSEAYAKMVLAQQDAQGFTKEQVSAVAKEVEAEFSAAIDRADGVQAYLGHILPIVGRCSKEYPLS